MYTFVVSSLCLRNYSTFILGITFVVSSLYVRNYFCAIFCTPSWLVFSAWETSGTIWSTISVMYMWGINMCFLALFDYPYMRNSYVLMLSFMINIHVLYTVGDYEYWLGIFVMTYSAPLISFMDGIIWFIYLMWYECLYMMHLTDLVYELLVTCMFFFLKNAGYLLRVSRLMETHMSTCCWSTTLYSETSCG